MGLYQALYAIGMFIGPVVFGSFADSYPLNIGFIATGVLAVIGCIMVFVTLKGTEETACLEG